MTNPQQLVSKLWSCRIIRRDAFRSFACLSAILLLTVVTGCGLTVQQKTAVQQFGSATSDFAALTRSEFIQSRQDVIKMNRLRVLLGDESVKSLDAPFTPDAMLPRIRALDALSDYGVLLQTLLNTSSEAELHRSAAGLVSSFNRVPDITMTDEQKNAIGRAVAFGGSGLVERKRAKAMKEVVELAHPHVTNLIQIVKRDFNPNADFWNAGYRQTIVDLEGAVEDASPIPDSDWIDLKFVRSARLTALENSARFVQVCNEIRETASALQAAEKKLRTILLSEHKIEACDIQGYSDRITEMKTLFEILRSTVSP
jgi:hypothetical protein